MTPAYRKLLRERSRLAKELDALLSEEIALLKKGLFDQANIKGRKAMLMHWKIREMDGRLRAMGG